MKIYLKTCQSRVGDYYLTSNAQATYPLRANDNFSENNTDYDLSVENDTYAMVGSETQYY